LESESPITKEGKKEKRKMEKRKKEKEEMNEKKQEERIKKRKRKKKEGKKGRREGERKRRKKERKNTKTLPTSDCCAAPRHRPVSSCYRQDTSLTCLLSLPGPGSEPLEIR
jgi:hypothetical protein